MQKRHGNTLELHGFCIQPAILSKKNLDGLVQERRNSIANALEL